MDDDQLDCELCGEPEDENDVLGHFRAPATKDETVLAHAQCGEDAGMLLA